MRYLIYPMLVLVLAVSSSLNAGTIHKWVDDQGGVHYSDSPPTKTESENVRVQSAPSNPGKALPRLTSPEASDKVSTGVDNQQKVSAEQASQICASARSDLDIINTSTRIKLKQADGGIRYLTDAEIAERKASSQAEVDRFCN